MAELHYYAQRKTVDNGLPETPSNQYGSRRQMERQYHLFCANALEGDEFAKEIYAIEWGTLETGAVEHIIYTKSVAQPEQITEQDNPEEPIEEPEGE